MKIKIVGIALIGVMLAGCGGKQAHPAEAPKAAPVRVRLVTAAQAEAPSQYEATGTVRARTAGTVSARMMGYVREVKFQVGDSVRQGQLLVVLDSREMESATRQAEAGLNEARSALPEVNNAVGAAKAQLELAQATFKRMQDLFDKKSISNQEYDEARARWKVAESGYQMALSRRSQLDARIKQAEAAVAGAQINRGWAEITAPFSGVVTEKRVEPGNLAAPGMPLATIEQAGSFRFEATVAESLLPSVRVGQAVTVELDALGKSFPARVSEIVPSVDAASRAFTVKADLPGAAGLRSGLFGRAVFALGKRSILAVPAGAAAQQGQVQSVLVVQDGVARARLVTLGEKLGGQVEVLSGLAAGEKVIHPRPAGLIDGAAVEVQP